MKRLIKIMLIGLVGVALVLLVLFIYQKQNEAVCEVVNININTEKDLFFIDVDDVWKIIRKTGDTLIGSRMKEIQIEKLKKDIASNVFVKEVKIYKTFGGKIHIEIEQRRPIVRGITSKAQHFYIDEEGLLMPVSKKFTSRIIIAHGNFGIDSISEKKLNEKDKQYLMKVLSNTKLKDVHAIATYIDTSSYWKAQLSEIIVNSKKEIELVPQFWPHIIQFGIIENMVEKFDKLFLFYRKELNKFDIRKYAFINLKYNNQIVCVKK